MFVILGTLYVKSFTVAVPNRGRVCQTVVSTNHANSHQLLMVRFVRSLTKYSLTAILACAFRRDLAWSTARQWWLTFATIVSIFTAALQFYLTVILLCVDVVQLLIILAKSYYILFVTKTNIIMCSLQKPGLCQVAHKVKSNYSVGQKGWKR